LNRHALFDNAFHSAETNFQLVHQKFAHASYPAVSKVINVIEVVFRYFIDQIHEVAHGFYYVFRTENT
jgi:hypothetical protein